MPTDTKLDQFTLAYIECALWSSTDDDGEPLDSGEHELAQETIDAMATDCAEFQRAHSELLEDLSSSQAGHDFWLTRNRHGAGFWDRGLGAKGDELTKWAHAWGSCDPYIGDDGLIYLA